MVHRACMYRTEGAWWYYSWLYYSAFKMAQKLYLKDAVLLD